MCTQSSDTSPEIERVQIELLRKAPLTKRFAIMASWSQFITEVAKQGKGRYRYREEVSSCVVSYSSYPIYYLRPIYLREQRRIWRNTAGTATLSLKALID
jgi:hypothetical protein